MGKAVIISSRALFVKLPNTPLIFFCRWFNVLHSNSVILQTQFSSPRSCVVLYDKEEGTQKAVEKGLSLSFQPNVWSEISVLTAMKNKWMTYLWNICPRVNPCWNSNTLVTWCKEPAHWKRPWCWERLKAGGDGDVRGWDGWMASQTRWTGVWASSGSWWWTRRPGALQSVDS